MGAKGTATLDFGAGPAITASVVVTGQTDILADSKVEAFLMESTTADNAQVDHKLLALFGSLVCGSIVAGTGFTITATLWQGFATGQFTINWVWD